MEILKLKLTGTSPLMMHSDRLANPLASETKAHKGLTGKRKKTDEDHLAIARSEFIAGAYWDSKVGFYVSGQNLDATFLAGAKLQKLGVSWKRGAMVMTDRAKLILMARKRLKSSGKTTDSLTLAASRLAPPS